MSGPHSLPMRYHLDNTIRALCPLIEERIKAQTAHHWREYDLRKELVGCILGSQIRHEMAIGSIANLDQAGLLGDDWWSSCEKDGFGSTVLDVLSGRRHDLPYRGCHRFPRARTSQLTRAREALTRVPLSARLANDAVPTHLRKSLVADIPGLGPKQASMFLRNIGKSYDLAILDIHVLRFIDLLDLFPMEDARINTVKGYERTERIVIDYADSLGYPVGYLDWAIWATMKAAQELGL